MEKEKVGKLEGIAHLQEGANEFGRLILSMKEQLIDPDVAIFFMSGMVGYSCQAALIEKKQNYYIVKTTNGKNYIYGDALNNYLFGAKESFYNILMGQFCHKLPQFEPLDIEAFLTRVSKNIGNEKYLIQEIFNPDTFIDFELYRSTWKKFYDTLIKYCKTPDEWPILFSIALCLFLDIFDSNYGRLAYSFFVYVALENAIYVSKIPQI